MPQNRQKLIEQERYIYALREADFAEMAEHAAALLPKESADPEFGTILRLMWRQYEDVTSKEWLDGLPERYRQFRADHAWVLKNRKVTGEITEAGLESLARLLVVIRNKERRREGGSK